VTGIDVKRYEETGLLFPIQVLAPAEVERFRAAAEETDRALREATPPVAPGERPVKMEGGCHLNFEWAHSLCTHPAILDVVEQILGGDILVHSATLFFKRPGKSFVSWHQDSNYWGLSQPRLVSAWVALSDSTVENGCLRLQPGTHRTLLEHLEVHHEDNMLGTGNTVKGGHDESQAVDVVLRAGEMSLHHAHLLHGSNANRSTGPRIGYAIRYLAADVTQSQEHHEVVLARGRQRHSRFKVQQEAPTQTVAEGLARHVEFSLRLHHADPDGLDSHR
jgi:ectoine hydroxylase-related dioxygenase (phytanoyl-CoA dioxygenase family)